MNENEAKLYRPDILGWSDDILPYYEEIVKNLPNNSKIVEVGVFHGRSAIFMIEQIALSNKSIDFYGVDINPCPTVLVNQLITFLEMSSVEAAKIFEDHSLDFVFLDGDHKYESVLEDIKTWLPKVRDNGIISGHDYCDEEYLSGSNNLKVGTHLEVIKAVNECFDVKFINRPTHTVWEYIKK